MGLRMVYTTKAGPQNTQSVNVNDDNEFQYWARHFGVTPEELKAAVSKVGFVRKDVQTELERVESEQGQGPS